MRAGVVIRAHDRVQKRDVLFHRDAVDAARRILTPLLGAGPGLLVKDAGLALGISRKFSVPLLGVSGHDCSLPGGLATAGCLVGHAKTDTAILQSMTLHGGDWGLVALLVFKTSGPSRTGGGFDSHPPPPSLD